MEERGREPLLHQILIGTLYAITIVQEDDGALVTQTAEQHTQALQLILHRTFHLIYMYTFRHLLLVHSVIYLLYSAHVYETRNLLCLGSRKQEVTAQARKRFHQTAHLIMETHLQTFIKFIDYEISDMVTVQIPLIKMIVQTAWSSEDYLWAHLLHHTMLIHCGTTSIASHGTKSATHILEHGGRLQRQLSTRSHHDSLRLIVAGINELRERQEISQRLTTTRRRKHYHISIGVQHGLHRILLHIVEFDTQLI